MAAAAGDRPLSVPERRTVGVSGGAFFWNALLFTRALRSAGLTTHVGAAIDYSRALTLIDIGEREQVRAAGLSIFVRRRDEVPVYDEVFARFWQRHELAIEAPPMDLEAPAIGAREDRAAGEIRQADEAAADALATGAAAEAEGEEGQERGAPR